MFSSCINFKSLITCGGFKLFNLFDQICLLVIKLFVFRSFCVKFSQEIDQLILVAKQNIKNRLGFVRICNKYLKRTNIIDLNKHLFNESENFTLKTWKASNCMFLDFSFNMFIINFKLSGFDM